MAISINSSVSKPTYQNIQSNQSIKLTLCERVSKIFSRLYEKISSLFSRKPSQMKALERIEPIYDVPQNNRPVKKLTLYERVTKFFSREPNRVELLEERVNRENAHLQKANQNLYQYIHKLETCVRALKDVVDAKETRINSLEGIIFSLEDDFYSHPQVSRSDSGFLEPASIEKKQSFLSKAKSLIVPGSK